MSRTESDPARLTGLAVLYSNFANSDPVRRILLRDGPFKSKIIAAPVPANSSGDPLPIIEISATGASKHAANVNTARVATALVKFIRQQQKANNIPGDDRVVLQTIQTPRKARLLAGRPKVVPMVVFVGVMGLVIGLALLLENLRPRPIREEIRVEPEPEAATRWRTPA